jgi:hypothetical protein
MQEHSSPTVDQRTGAWAAILYAVLLTLFNAAFIGMLFAVPDLEWRGADHFVQAFSLIQFGPQSIGLLLLPVQMVLVVSIYRHLPQNHRLWGLVGLVFQAGFVLLTLGLYFIQLGVVLPAVLRGDPAYLDLLAFANPRSPAWALNNFGWGFLLGLGLVFLGFAFPRGTKLERWIFWLLLMNGLSSFFLVVGYVLDDFNLQIPTVLSWLVGLPGVSILLAFWFKKQRC